LNTRGVGPNCKLAYLWRLKISNTSSAVATLAGAVTVGLDLTIASGSALDYIKQ